MAHLKIIFQKTATQNRFYLNLFCQPHSNKRKYVPLALQVPILQSKKVFFVHVLMSWLLPAAVAALHWKTVPQQPPKLSKRTERKKPTSALAPFYWPDKRDNTKVTRKFFWLFTCTFPAEDQVEPLFLWVQQQQNLQRQNDESVDVVCWFFV